MVKKKNFSKPFGEWVINLKNNSFFKARLKLTFFYIAVIFIILVIFSIILYFSFINNIEEDIEGDFADNQAQVAVILKVASQLRNLILLIDIAIMLAISWVSFWLAGRTLLPLQRNYELQKQFMTDASHELRTPLSIIKTDLEVELKNPKNLKKSLKIHSSNLEEINRMSKIVNELFLISRLENNQEIFRFSSIKLFPIIQKAVKNLEIYAKNKNISFSFDVVKEQLSILGDTDKLMQAFYNILKNAIDYSGNEGKISISLKKTNNKAKLTISDKGIGIAKEELPLIFDRFYRADKARSNDIMGSGLGLSITKAIIHKHKGTITIESSIEKGTEVVLIFPLVSSS